MAAASKTRVGNQLQELGIEPLLIYDSVRIYKVLGQIAVLVKEFAGADRCRNPAEIRKVAFEKFCSELSYSGVEPRDLANEIESLRKFFSKNGMELEGILLGFNQDSQKFPCSSGNVAALVDGIGYMDCTLKDIGERKARLRGSGEVNWDNFYPGNGTVWQNTSSELKLTFSRKREFVLALGEAVMSNSIRLYYSRNAPLEDEREFAEANGNALFSFMNKLAAIARGYGINPASIELLDLSRKMEESAANRDGLERSMADASAMLAQYFSAYLGIKSGAAAGMAKVFIESKALWLPDIKRGKQRGPKFGSLDLDALWKKGDGQLQIAALEGTALAEAIAGIAIPNGIRGYASSYQIAVYSQASKQEVDKAGEALEYVMEYYLGEKAIAEFENMLKSKQIDPSKIRLPDLRKSSGDIVKARSKEERNSACKKATDALSEYFVDYLGIDQLAAIEIAAKYSSFDHTLWTALRRSLLEKQVPERIAAEEAQIQRKPHAKMQDVNRYNFCGAETGTIWEKAGVQPSREDMEGLAKCVAGELLTFSAAAVMERLYFETGEGRSEAESYGRGKGGKAIETIANRLGIKPGEIGLLDLRPEVKAFIESKSSDELQRTAYEPAEKKVLQYLVNYFGVNEETAKIIMQDCIRGSAGENYYGWPSLKGIAVPDSTIAAGAQPTGTVWESTKVKSITQEEKDRFATMVPQAAIFWGIGAYLADTDLPQELAAEAVNESNRLLKPVQSGIVRLGVERSAFKLPDLSSQIKQVVESEYEGDRHRAWQGMKSAIANYLVYEFGVGLVKARTEAENCVDDNRLWTMLPRRPVKPDLRTEENPAPVPAQQPSKATPPAMAPAPTPQAAPQAAAAPEMTLKPYGEISSKLWTGVDMHTEVINLVSEKLAAASLFASMVKVAEREGVQDKIVAEARENAKKAWDGLVAEVRKEMAAIKKEAPGIVLIDVSPQITSMLSGGKVGSTVELETALKNYLVSYSGTNRANSIATNYVDDLVLRLLKPMLAKPKAMSVDGARLRTEESDKTDVYWSLDTSETDQGILDLRPDSSVSVADYVTLAMTSVEVSILSAIIAACGDPKLKSQKISGVEDRTRDHAAKMNSWQESAEAAKRMKFEGSAAVKTLFLKDIMSELISSESEEQRAAATGELDSRLTAYLVKYMKMPPEMAKKQASQKISLVNTLLFGIPIVEAKEMQAQVSSPPVPTRTVGDVGITRQLNYAVPSEKEAKIQKERALFDRLKLGDSIKVFATERDGTLVEGDMLRYEVRTRPGGFPSIHVGTSFFIEGGVLDTYAAMKNAGKTLEKKQAAALDAFGPRLEEARRIAAELAELDRMEKDFGALRASN